jgi:hypothetical protein
MWIIMDFAKETVAYNAVPIVPVDIVRFLVKIVNMGSVTSTMESVLVLMDTRVNCVI